MRSFVHKIHRELSAYWPLLIFLAVMLWQHAYIYLYHDDFGYATLRYLGPLADGSAVSGHQFTLGQMLTFLKMHYQLWGGRVLPFFLLISMLRWGVWVYRILQSIVLTLILLFASKLVIGDKESKRMDWMIPLTLAALYCLIPILIQNEGTYWATGSVLYAWPFLWIFAAGYLLQQYANQKGTRGGLILLFFLYFASGFSQEQVFFTAFFMLLGFLIDHLVTKKGKSIILVDAVCLAALGLGYLLLMIAPGNQLRAQLGPYQSYYALSLFDRVRANLPVLLEITFGRSNLIIFGFMLLINTLTLIPQVAGKQKGWTLSLILSVIQFIYLILFAGMILSSFSIVRNSAFGGLAASMDAIRKDSVLFWVVFVVIASIPPVLLTWRRRTHVILGLYFGGIAGLATSLLIPTVQYRSILVLFFPLFVVFTWMLADAMKQGKYRLLAYTVLGLMLIFTAANTSRILIGYQRNSTIQAANDRILKAAQLDISAGAPISIIHLQRLIGDQYAAKMPYESNYEYINVWIKDYYQIPQAVELEWDE